MRRDEIERIAERILEEIPEGSRPAVPIKDVARRLGLPIVKTNLGEGVSACLVTEGGRAYIGVRDGDPSNRKRFSIAHECGHHVLQHPRDAVHLDREHDVSFRAVLYRSTRTAPGDPREAEANQFAACILMPAKRVRREAAKIGPALTDEHIDTLAKLFEVSPAAMAIRLQVLRLL